MSRLLLLSTLFFSFASTGADSVGRARELFKQARQRYEARQYAEAAALFQQSYDLSNAPALLFNLGQAWRNHGDCTRALGAYRLYLERNPKASNVAEVNEFIAVMERCVREQSAATAPAPTPPGPAATPVEPVEPVSPASQSDLIGLPSAPAQPPSPWLTVTAVTLDVLGVGALGVGTAFSVMARGASERLEEAYLGRFTWTPEFAALERTGRRDSVVGVALLVAGAALAVSGLVVTIIRLMAEPAEGALAWAGGSY